MAGKVVRVFRTDGRLEEGDDINWTIWVCRPGDEPTGTAYIYGDDLATRHNIALEPTALATRSRRGSARALDGSKSI